MIIKCTNCGGALIFDIPTRKMKCSYCHSFFPVENAPAEIEPSKKMTCRIVHCTSCGAELAINSVESATFCAYCGQPTIVFKRISKMQKPQAIIPFSITKEDAVTLIRKRIKKGSFIPRGLKNFELERVNGIYIPFWIYDIKYSDRQILNGKNGKKTYDYLRKAEWLFKNVTLDASSNLYDQSAQRLEPFDMKDLVPFHEGYLSGFYADKYDRSAGALENLAFERCKDIFDFQMKLSVPASFVTIERSKPKRKVLKHVYALFPAWFLTIRYKNKAYTLLVNGQTGKIVGGLPFTKYKVILLYFSLLILLAPLLGPLISTIYDFFTSKDEFFLFMAGYICIGGFILMIGASVLSAIKEHIKDTSTKEIENFSKHREKGDSSSC